MIKYLDEDYVVINSKSNNIPIQNNIELVHIKQSFVLYKNALLACKKTYLSSIYPTLLYNTEGDITGVNSEYWIFVFELAEDNKEGINIRLYSNRYQRGYKIYTLSIK